MEQLAALAVYAYFAILFVLSLYGAHRYFILFLYWKHYKRAPRRAAPAFDAARAPSVTVQLPLYNELYVARRVIESAARLRYPRHLLCVQVLDDSTDGTCEIARRAVRDLRAQGHRIDYYHRDDREGFKAGALKAGLEQTDDELVAIFDADFVPPADFLERVVPHFADGGVGMVQTRWGYLNRGYSLLTRVQSILLDGHFVLEHTARSRSGRFFNFNGTGGVFRRRAILEAGGWEGDTLTEDLDLSYRAQLAGWRFVFLPDVECPSELPVDVFGFKNQQHRWTKGSIQVGRKLLPKIWRSTAPLAVKLEATFHLSANLSYLLLVMLSLLMPLSVLFRASALARGTLAWEALIFGLTTASIFLFYVVAQRELYPDWKWRIRDIPFILSLGIGMCVNNAWAVSEALVGRDTPFVRTAKYRIESFADRWKGKAYRSSPKASFWLELLLCAYMVLALVMVVATRSWAALPYVGLFVAGFTYVFGLSVAHARR
ncbi:MAG: glycosyltransferase [Candidatus Krumholzibacteria bacterium]|nr:glycosyltransferase [Candidatus Krumholzibacteria bacterium]